MFVATLSTTAELREDDNVNTLYVNGVELQERTAERIYPNDEVSAVFGNDMASGLIQTPIGGVSLNLRNVRSWIKCSPPPETVPAVAAPELCPISRTVRSVEFASTIRRRAYETAT